MLRRIAKIVVIVLLALVAVAFLFRDSRLAAQIRFAGSPHVPSIDADYRRLSDVVPSKAASIINVFPGLPHNYWGEEAFIRELWNSENQPIHGYRFYSKPLSFSEEFRRVVHDLFTEEKTFVPYRGPKKCGGYHADFAVLLDDAGEHYWFLVCLGCHEVLCFTDQAELICELDSAAYKKLSTAWKKQTSPEGEGRR